MKVYDSIEDFKRLDNAVVSIGTFDGVHLGHKKLIEKINAVTREQGAESVIISFDPHPRVVLYGDENLSVLTTSEEKAELLAKEGIDQLIIQPFTKEFAATDALDFVHDILLEKIGCKTLVIGYDHRFGRGREGSFEHLSKFHDLYGFDLVEIPREDIDDISVSSTKIRRTLLEKGDIQLAKKLLGHPYSITGKVVPGHHVGREIGFPTANILIRDKYKLIPKDGVYAVCVQIGTKEYMGMTNIGKRPTLNGEGRTIETHILDFSKDIYGCDVKLTFVCRLRDEQKFPGLDALKEQLAHDKDSVRALLEKNEP